MSQPIPQNSKRNIPIQPSPKRLNPWSALGPALYHILSGSRLPPTPVSRPNDPTTEAFWNSFSVFLSPFEKFCAQRWYIFGIVFFTVEFVTTWIGNLIAGSQYHETWKHFLFSSSYSAFSQGLLYDAYVAGMVLALGLFNRWQQSIPQFFHTLEQRCHIADGIEKSYQTYLAEYQCTLLYGKGSVLTRPLLVGVVTLCSFVTLVVYFVSTDIPLILKPPNVIIALALGLWSFIDDFVYPLLLIYLVTSFVWIMGTTGLYVRRWLDHFPPQIQLTHPDNCGGFKFLGNFALNMALVILAGATLLAIDIIWRMNSFWALGPSILLLFLIIASYGTFFAPISAVHRHMLIQRCKCEDAVASRIVKIEEQIDEALKKGDLGLLQTAKEELGVMQTLFPDTGWFSNWPFNSHMLITFFGSQIIPIIISIIEGKSAILGLLAQVFHF